MAINDRPSDSQVFSYIDQRQFNSAGIPPERNFRPYRLRGSVGEGNTAFVLIESGWDATGNWQRNGVNIAGQTNPAAYVGTSADVIGTKIGWAPNSGGYIPQPVVVPLIGNYTGPIIGINKIPNILAAIRNSATSRQVLPGIGMSLMQGSDANNSGTLTAADVLVFRQSSWLAIASKRINTLKGGTFSPGREPVCINFGANTLNPLLTLLGGAVLSAAYQTGGTGGRYVGLVQGSGASIRMTAIGSVIRTWAVCTGNSAITYSINGAADVTAPAMSTAFPTGTGTSYFQEFSIPGLTPGDVVTFKPPTLAGSNWLLTDFDVDYVGSGAGLTMPRVATGGSSLATLTGIALDATDTQPAGTWIGAVGSQAYYRRTATFESMTTRIGTIPGVIGSMDVNDVRNTAPVEFSFSAADLRRHADNYFAGLAAKGLECLYTTSSLRDPAIVVSYGATLTQDQVIQIYKDAAAAAPNAAFYDCTQVYGAGASLATRFAAQSASGRMYNEPHWNSAGHLYFGNDLGDQLLLASNYA